MAPYKTRESVFPSAHVKYYTHNMSANHNVSAGLNQYFLQCAGLTCVISHVVHFQITEKREKQ